MSSQVRERISRVELKSAKMSRMPFGLMNGRELAAALIVLILLILVIVYYFVSLRPEQDRLSALEADFDARQQIILTGLTEGGDGESENGDTSRDALESLEAFKTKHLKPLNQGRIALIEEINALSRKNGVQLMTGIDMRLVRQEAEEKQKARQRNRSELKMDVFPRLSVRFTVLGQYSNLRAFINELDHSKQFMVIDSINLSNVEQSGGGGGRRSASSTGISLSIDMSAFFQPR